MSERPPQRVRTSHNTKRRPIAVLLREKLRHSRRTIPLLSTMEYNIHKMSTSELYSPRRTILLFTENNPLLSMMECNIHTKSTSELYSPGRTILLFTENNPLLSMIVVDTSPDKHRLVLLKKQSVRTARPFG